MTDFGLYSGLMRKSNIFETKAQNRQMELQIAERQEARSKQKLAAQAEVDAKIQEFYDTVNQLDILEQDKERVNAADKRYRTDVINGIKQYNGNLEQFMLTGGAGTLAAYRNNLMQSVEVTNAITNKTNYAQWMNAQANGLWVKDVGVDVDVVNPDGTVTKERRVVPVDQAWGMFEKGQIEQFPWDGAEQDIDVGPEIFQTLYKDPRNPYSQETEVTPQDVYLWVREHGGSHDQATGKMEKYVQYRDQGGTEWRYKSGDIMEYKIKQQQLANMRQQHKMNSMQMQQQLGSNSVLDFQARIRNAGPGEDIKLLPEEEEFFAKQFGFVWDEELGQYKTTRNLDVLDRWSENNPNPATYNLSQFDSFYPEGYTIGPNGEVMLKLKASYSDYNNSGADNSLPLTEGLFGNDSRPEGAHLNNFSAIGGDSWGDDRYEGNVYIPITDYYTNDYNPSYLNKQIGVRSNADMTPSRMTNEQRYQQNAQMLDGTINSLVNIIGGNYGDAGEMLYQFVTDEEDQSGGQGAQNMIYEQGQ
ncbi:MAG TPA: hypothetical protein DGG95_13415 [Cytophagales bacterium]|jgi:hypothetical protein|nr:hypothetical protein [Cytophagales bacterium]